MRKLFFGLIYFVTHFIFLYSVRVANELGRGDAKAVKFSIKVILSTSVTIGLLFFILCLVFGNKLGYLFTDDEAVANTVTDLSTLLAFSILFNSIYPVFSGFLSVPFLSLVRVMILLYSILFKALLTLVKSKSEILSTRLLISFALFFFFVTSGVAVGSGMQANVAIINVVCFYLIGLPVGVVLGYVAHLQVKVKAITFPSFAS